MDSASGYKNPHHQHFAEEENTTQNRKHDANHWFENAKPVFGRLQFQSFSNESDESSFVEYERLVDSISEIETFESPSKTYTLTFKCLC